jgi:glycosyltransferase involved in cell wall biosynthesis
MKVCIFTENHLKGGVDTFLINLINAWPVTEDSLTLMCNSSHPGLETISQKVKRNFVMKKYNRFFATKLAAGQDKYGVGQLFVIRAFYVLTYRLLQYPVLFPWYVFSLSIKFRKSEFERLLVVNGGYPASLLCRSAIIAWRISGKSQFGIMNFHNSAPKALGHLRHFENFIDRLVARSSAHIVTVTRNCLDSLENRPAFTTYQYFKVINNGIEDSLVLNSHQIEKLDDSQEDVPYLLMLATYEPRKGHLFLLKAFQSIHQAYPDLKLKIYGYSVGNQKTFVSDEVSRLGLEALVELNDFTSEISDLIRYAKVLVVPSQEYESFNLTIIEAMAYGVPIVATDVGGMPEVLHGSGAGYVCTRDDPVEFAAAVLKILGDSALTFAMRSNGRRCFEDRFTAQRMAIEYKKLLN